jgi:hypothetical protein
MTLYGVPMSSSSGVGAGVGSGQATADALSSDSYKGLCLAVSSSLCIGGGAVQDP